MSIILNLDTATETASVCIAREGITLAMRSSTEQKDHASWIQPAIMEVLQEAGIVLRDVQAVAVTAGPGSYTGLRVGLSAAKGLCFALSKPLMLFHKLFLLALSTSRVSEGSILIALKARQEELFVAGYDNTMQEMLPPQHIFQNELEIILPEYNLVLTNYEELPIFEGHKLLPLHHEIKMEKWTMHAAERYVQQEFDDLAYSEPFYLKAAYTTTAKKKI